MKTYQETARELQNNIEILAKNQAEAARRKIKTVETRIEKTLQRIERRKKHDI